MYHDFVQDRARRVVHLVKLVDAADAAVAQDERTAATWIGPPPPSFIAECGQICAALPRRRALSCTDGPFQDELLGVRVLGDVGRQTDGGRALAGRVDAARGQLVHVLQRLRLGRAGIAAQQNVDLAAAVHPTGPGTREPGRKGKKCGVLPGGLPRPLPEPLVGSRLVRAAKQLAQDALLDVVHLVDRRSCGETTQHARRTSAAVR